MKRKNKTKSSLFYEKRLFSFYLKKNILSMKFIICIILSLIPLFQILDYYKSRYVFNQSIIDEQLYWEDFIEMISYFFSVLRLLPVIIAVNVVSGEFSNKSAMIIYTTESRNKILAIKLLCLIISILILILFYFSAFLIMIFNKTELLVSINIFLIGFLILFIGSIFISSLTFMISALTRNILASFILPIFYIFIEVYLEDLELGLLSYSSYTIKVIYFFENLIFHEQIILSSIKIICIIAFFGIPILIILITFYSFKQQDLRID